MQEQLTLQLAGSFLRTQHVSSSHYTLHVMVKVSNVQGPVGGLTKDNFQVRMGELDFGAFTLKPHADAARFTGIYQFTQVFDAAMWDTPVMLGLLLCIQVKVGAQVGTGVVSLSQINLTHD